MELSPPLAPGRCRFGLFEFDIETLELTKKGRPMPLRPQPAKVLALLLARPGELISRSELERALWGGDTFVDFEQGVNHAIRELRATLGDSAESPRFVQTLPRLGYRFIAPVEKPDPHAGGEAELAGPPPLDAGVSPRSAWRLLVLAAGFAALLTMIIGASLSSRWGGLASAYPSIVLAVRPFAAPSDAALGVGLANTISARLGGQQAVAVRSSDPTHEVSGDVSIAGDEVIVLARLKDVVKGSEVWSERIRVQADRLFSVEDVIAERVVGALRLRLAAAEQDRLRRRYTSNNAAYADYLRGRAALVKYTPDDTRLAIEAFEAALNRDPGYALARAGLAMACADMYLRFAPAAEVDRWGERAEDEARQALALDADLAEAHLARAAVARKREFDWSETVAAGRRALVLNPNLEQGRFFVAAAYYHHGYMEEAIIEMEKGRSLHGADVIEPIRIEALVSLFSGSFAPARARLEEVSRLSSQAIGDTYLALSYYYTGSVERALTMLEALARNRSASTSSRAGAALAGVLAAEGQKAAGRAQLERVLAADYRDHHVAYSIGVAYAQVGDLAEADRWLRTAADTGFPCLPFFERDPLLEPLRRTPAFPVLLEYVRQRRDASLSQKTR